MRVVFAYIPVIHKQVLSFLKEHKECPIWLLDNEAGVKDNVYLERDARALHARDVHIELNAHGFKDVLVVNQDELKKNAPKVSEFIIPEDEITRSFLEKFAPEVPITAINIFIRWTQQLSTTESKVSAHRVISTETFAQELLQNLQDEAQKSPDWWRQIATAIVSNNTVIATAYNKHLPTSHSLSINGDPRSNLDAGQSPGIYTSIHAEAAVIAEAAKAGKATNGCDMYVTTFPCPTCARLLIEAGFKRIFYKAGYSVLDAEELLTGAGIEIILVQE